jgi:hypothetical protein
VSHVVQVQTEVRDVVAIRGACGRLGLAEPVYGEVNRGACGRLGLAEPVYGEVKLFSSTAVGWAVRLPGWRYPVVCDVVTAKVAYDNFEGRWGEQKQLDAFLAELCSREGSDRGQAGRAFVTEQPLADGSIKLTIQMGGAY